MTQSTKTNSVHLDDFTIIPYCFESQVMHIDTAKIHMAEDLHHQHHIQRVYFFGIKYKKNMQIWTFLTATFILVFVKKGIEQKTHIYGALGKYYS